MTKKLWLQLAKIQLHFVNNKPSLANILAKFALDLKYYKTLLQNLGDFVYKEGLSSILCMTMKTILKF